MVKNLLAHLLVVAIPIILLSPLNAWAGFAFGVGLNLGREIAQVELRAFRRGKSWNTITLKDYLDPQNWKSIKGGWRDTFVDNVVPVIFGILLCITIEGGLS